MPEDIWIPEYLTNGKTESDDDQTLYIDLPTDEQIGMIMIECRVTNTSTVNNLRSILDIFGDIEVRADGVKTLFSLPVEIASYAAFVAQGGVLPDHRFFDGGGAVSRIHLPIWFGRFPWDRDYLLDTSLYKSVQLRIPYTLNTTYEATGTFQHTITYWRPLEKLSPAGFVRWQLVKRETPSAAAQTITHKLPNAYPWYYVGVRVDDVDQDINTDLTAIDLSMDAGRLHLLDVDADEALYLDKLRYANANSYVNQPVVTGQDTVHTFAEWGASRGATMVGTGARIVGVDQVAGEQCRITILTDTGVQASDAIPVLLEVRSQNPHKCLTLYDGRRSPFPAPDHSEPKVEYDIAAYTMTLETFVAELVPGAL